MGSRAVARHVEGALIAIGLALVSLASLGFVASSLRTWDAHRAIDAPSSMPQSDVLTGLLEIPRLGLQAAVAEGDDTLTLLTAVGHLPDSSVPWRGGNTVLAGHRDQLFRGLGRIRTGDAIQLRTSHGTFAYVVQATRIVAPTYVEVANPGGRPRLTLVTCYPFSYFGHAPERFVVIAEPTQSP